MSISLDGFVAGPDQSLEHPLGRRGIELHHWHLDEPLHDTDARARDLLLRPRGAYVMGRNMFGPIRGPWLEDWRGWWGDEPPYHAPVFVLTHYEHEPIELEGGTTFHFVTDGFGAAFARANEAAGEQGVDIAGGASAVRQACDRRDRRARARLRPRPARWGGAHLRWRRRSRPRAGRGHPLAACDPRALPRRGPRP
jgi:dihydrofolate reductase